MSVTSFSALARKVKQPSPGLSSFSQAHSKGGTTRTSPLTERLPILLPSRPAPRPVPAVTGSAEVPYVTQKDQNQLADENEGSRRRPERGVRDLGEGREREDRSLGLADEKVCKKNQENRTRWRGRAYWGFGGLPFAAATRLPHSKSSLEQSSLSTMHSMKLRQSALSSLSASSSAVLASPSVVAL